MRLDLIFANAAIALCVFRLCRLLYRVIYPFVIGRLLPNHTLHRIRQLGEWAVITGSTDGIGKAFAFALAKRGFNICLLSRNAEKLYAVSMDIRDLSPAGSYGEVESLLNDIKVSVLVNNVGASPGRKYFHTVGSTQEDLQGVTAMLNINVTSFVVMTKLCLRGMVERNGGVILNVSSMLGCDPSPMFTLYSATKYAMVQFSKSIQAEHKNIEVLCLTPAFVMTNMTAGVVCKPSFFDPTPDSYAEQALNTVGLNLGVTTGCLAHELQMISSLLAPDYVYMFISKHVLKSRFANHYLNERADFLY